MSNFVKFAQAVEKRFQEMSKKELFITGDADLVWEQYLYSFPEGTNPIYKTRTTHDCTCCRNFVKNIGNVVTITNGKIETIWNLKGLEAPFDVVAASLNKFVLGLTVTGVFRKADPKFGAEVSRQLDPDTNKVINWNHFFGTVHPKHFLTKDNIGTKVGEINTTIQLFQRGLNELSLSAIDTVYDLIKNNALYRGEEHLESVSLFRQALVEYNKLSAPKKKLYALENHAFRFARFRNSVIGTLVQDLSEGVDLEKAVKSFETKVAPANYKRPTALITPGMIKQAMKTIEDLNLEPALHRRYANLSDVSVNNVLWVDNATKPLMKDGLEGLLMSSVKETNIAKPNHIEDITIEEFMELIKSAQSINMRVGKEHLPNFMSITAPETENTGKLFKWNNDFAWSYDGDVADSIKEKVKRAGGNVDAKLRFSLAWFNYDDLDIHVTEPSGHRIYFAQKRGKYGTLDVDMNAGSGTSRQAVENVAFNTTQDGTYKVVINQYSKRENKDYGFVVEVASGSGVTQYSYKKAVSGNVTVGEFKVQNGSIVSTTMGPGIVGEGISTEKWGINTENYAKVQTLMLSPNYWDDNKVGNKHWFFILEGISNTAPTRGIYNEFLHPALEKHRKVFEVLGDKTKCPPSSNQLSGLGFSSTRKDKVQVCVNTKNAQRHYNINF
jgi:hypothetical protein